MEQTRDQQVQTESKARLVEQVTLCLHSGDYSRSLELLRGAAELPGDADLSQLETLAHDGVKRNAEANLLITQSQGLFAQQKSAEAIQSLRKAYELDKNNSLARTILANALVEHAHSLVETNWLEAETLTNQALRLNPAHPTAKTILSLIVYQKKTSSVEDWVAQAIKLQSSGDLFAAMAWVAEGLAVHPHDPKLLLIQDGIQRDQDARRRQTRRRDFDDLRRMEREIDSASDVAAKQALAERIQAVAAKYWTDGEFLSVANGLLQRLGLAAQGSSTASSQSKSGAVIFHVPRPTAPKPQSANTNQIPTTQPAHSTVAPTPLTPTPVTQGPVQAACSPAAAAPEKAQQTTVPPSEVSPSKLSPSSPPPAKRLIAPAEPKLAPPPAATVPAAESFVTAVQFTSPSSQSKQVKQSNSTTLILISAASAAIFLCATIFFFVRKHATPPVAKSPEAPPVVAVPIVSAPAATAPPDVSAPAQTTSESTLPAPSPSSGTASGKITANEQPPAESAHNFGTLTVVAGQDGAKVFLNGKVQRQLTQAGQLRLPNLEARDYVVQVTKSGFQDPPQQTIRVRNREHARLVFNLQLQPPPQPRLASLAIHGGLAGTAVFIDQSPVGAIQSDGTLSVSNVNSGDHNVELRKEKFKSRQLKEHFVAGGVISLAAADAALEPASGELKITFTPADAKVAIVRNDSLTLVSSGVPVNLAAGTYTLTARTPDRFMRSATLEVVAGQSKTLDLPLAANGMSKWDNPAAWKRERDSFIRKGGDFVLYGVVPASGTFVFSAMPVKGRLLQWVLNYIDPKNYILCQMDENYFYRIVIRNGAKTDEIKIPEKSDKKSFRTLRIRVSATELLQQIKHGDSWPVVDRWSQPAADLGRGKFGLYIPGDDQVALSSFQHYADLNLR